MFARVSTYQGDPASFDESVRIADQKAAPLVREMDGNLGLMVLADRSSGRSISITLWESEEALKASEEAANKLRSETSAEQGDEILGVERFEVVIDERR